MDLEWPGPTFLLAKLLDPRDESVEFLRVAAAVHPAVGAGRAAQRRVGVAADQDRNRLRRSGSHLRLGNVIELAVEFEVVAGGQPADDLDALVNSLAALGERDTHQLVVLGPRAGADAEPHPVADQRRQRTGLLGHQRRRPDRQLEDEEVESQRRRHRAEGGGQHERLDERLAVQEFAVAVGRVRILRVGLERIGDAVRNCHAGVPGCFGGLCQRNVKRRVGHRLRIAEPHIVSFTGSAQVKAHIRTCYQRQLIIARLGGGVFL